MDRADWLLAAIAISDQGFSPVQAQKTMFLLGREAPGGVGQGFYTFRPYDYGPFDSAIYDDVALLADRGLVAVERSPGRSWPRYSATAAGVAHFEGLKNSVAPNLLLFLGDLTHWVTSQSFAALLRAIYDQFPEYKVNSVFAR